MIKKPRQKIKVMTEQDLDSPSQFSQSETLKEHDIYDQENYDPTSNLDEKEVHIPKKIRCCHCPPYII